MPGTNFVAYLSKLQSQKVLYHSSQDQYLQNFLRNSFQSISITGALANKDTIMKDIPLYVLMYHYFNFDLKTIAKSFLITQPSRLFTSMTVVRNFN